MFDSKLLASALVALLVLAAVAPATTAASSQQRAYAGSNVSFDTTSTAVVDYAVDGETMLESVRVQSESEVESGLDVGVDVDVSAVTNFAGAGLSVAARSETGATVGAESGAEMHAHDSDHGILVVESGSESQYVGVNLSNAADAESEGDGRVVVTTENGTQGTFIVVGDGTVTVNEEGNVTAKLDDGSRLVFRAYGGERTEDETRQEKLIANGTAAAEVYVRESGEGSGELVAGVANYSGDTAVEVTQTSEGMVTMTAERAENEGRIVITSVSEAVVNATDDVTVSVDGEAAVEATSYSELEAAADGGPASKFLVRGQSDARAGADVLVAVNHFSERTITVSDGGSGDGPTATPTDDATATPTSDGSGDSGSDGSTDTPDDGDPTDTVTDDGQTDASGGTDGDGDDSSGSDDNEGPDESTPTPGAPGLGIGAAVIALLAGALLAVRSR